MGLIVHEDTTGGRDSSHGLPVAPARRISALSVYAWIIGLCGLGLSLPVWVMDPPFSAMVAEPAPLLVLMVCLVIGELFPIPVARGDATTSNVTISTTFAVALLVVGPVSLVLLAHLIAVFVDDARAGRRPVQMIFNIGQYSLSLIAARAVFSLTTGVPFGADYNSFTPAHLPQALLAGVVFAAANHIMVGIVVSLATGLSLRRSFGQDLRFELETSAVLVGMAPLTCLVIDAAVLMLPLVMLPIVAVRRSAQMAAFSERQALRDPLTGLGNRSSMQLHLQRQLRSHRERGGGGLRTGLAMMLIDLDHFKDVNDNLGHDVGDLLLVEVSARLQAAAPAGSHVVRLGGDEFAILVHGSAEGDAMTVAQHTAQTVLDAFLQPVDVGDTRLAVQGSIGVAAADDEAGLAQLLKHADIALYEAKEVRARFAVYHPRQDEAEMERLTLLTHLTDAVRRKELTVAYQPQVDCRTGRITSFEALVRWEDERFAAVPADVLVSLAENAGLIDAVSDQVLETALADVARWRARGHDVSVAVNLSARQLSNEALPDRIRQALDLHGVPPRALVVEVTETSLMADARRADIVLQSLRRLGVMLSIDDFGTGYSSLSRLRDIAVDELKIDRAFVADMSDEKTNDTLVRAIIDLARNLGLEVVAEGVETEWTAMTLAALGCDRLQGWFLARPVPADQVLALLQDSGPIAVMPRPGWLAVLPTPALPTPALPTTALPTTALPTTALPRLAVPTQPTPGGCATARLLRGVPC